MRKKYFITFLLILFQSFAFSQDTDPGPGMFEDADDLNGGNSNGGLEGTTGDNTPGTPIDDNIFYLMIAATLYGSYVFSKKDKYNLK